MPTTLRSGVLASMVALFAASVGFGVAKAAPFWLPGFEIRWLPPFVLLAGIAGGWASYHILGDGAGTSPVATLAPYGVVFLIVAWGLASVFGLPCAGPGCAWVDGVTAQAEYHGVWNKSQVNETLLGEGLELVGDQPGERVKAKGEPRLSVVIWVASYVEEGDPAGVTVSLMFEREGEPAQVYPDQRDELTAQMRDRFEPRASEIFEALSLELGWERTGDSVWRSSGAIA